MEKEGRPPLRTAYAVMFFGQRFLEETLAFFVRMVARWLCSGLRYPAWSHAPVFTYLVCAVLRCAAVTLSRVVTGANFHLPRLRHATVCNGYYPARPPGVVIVTEGPTWIGAGLATVASAACSLVIVTEGTMAIGRAAPIGCPPCHRMTATILLS